MTDDQSLNADLNWLRNTEPRALDRAVLGALVRGYHLESAAMLTIATIAKDAGCSYSGAARSIPTTRRPRLGRALHHRAARAQNRRVRRRHPSHRRRAGAPGMSDHDQLDLFRFSPEPKPASSRGKRL